MMVKRLLAALCSSIAFLAGCAGGLLATSVQGVQYELYGRNLSFDGDGGSFSFRSGDSVLIVEDRCGTLNGVPIGTFEQGDRVVLSANGVLYVNGAREGG